MNTLAISFNPGDLIGSSQFLSINSPVESFANKPACIIVNWPAISFGLKEIGLKIILIQ